MVVAQAGLASREAARSPDAAPAVATQRAHQSPARALKLRCPAARRAPCAARGLTRGPAAAPPLAQHDGKRGRRAAPRRAYLWREPRVVLGGVLGPLVLVSLGAQVGRRPRGRVHKLERAAHVVQHAQVRDMHQRLLHGGEVAQLEREDLCVCSGGERWAARGEAGRNAGSSRVMPPSLAPSLPTRVCSLVTAHGNGDSAPCLPPVVCVPPQPPPLAQLSSPATARRRRTCAESSCLAMTAVWPCCTAWSNSCCASWRALTSVVMVRSPTTASSLYTAARGGSGNLNTTLRSMAERKGARA